MVECDTFMITELLLLNFVRTIVYNFLNLFYLVEKITISNNPPQMMKGFLRAIV
jgi:hypothetical protein